MKNFFYTFIFLMNFILYSQSHNAFSTQANIDNQIDFFEESVACEQETLPFDFVVPIKPRIFSIKDIPLYIKITTLGLYESKIKPFYKAIIAYLKSIQLKIRK